MPRGLARTKSAAWSNSGMAMLMMMQSVAGLAAEGVNEGRSDELVWIATDNQDIEAWGAAFRENHPAVADRGVFDPWALVKRYVDRGLIKGYILYRADHSQADPKTKERPDLDQSVNIATSAAGILGGVLVEESLQKEAESHGLKLLLDARDKTPEWCFDTYKGDLNRHLINILDPKIVGLRDYAIAHRVFTLYGPEKMIAAVMAWVEPPAPVLGWMPGDEFKATRLASINGLFQTASSLCPNLNVLSAGTQDATPPKMPHLDPRQIDWKDTRSTITFSMSDGDNLSWTMSGLFLKDPYYWSCPNRGAIPFGWSLPLAHLTQLGLQPFAYALKTRTPNDWFLEWHGGYYYPDLYAIDRPDRWALLARHAADTWALMKQTGSRIIGFNLRDLQSPDALKALQTIATQTDGLIGILAFQYSPYNGGEGKVFWVKDKKGINIPVVTLRYQIWWRMKNRENAGTPAKVAKDIINTIAQSLPADLPRHDWAMIQAWSYFKKAPGTDASAEDFPAKKNLPADVKYENLGGTRGYEPMLWCAQRLPQSIHIVSPEEMFWRIRMQKNPEETRRLIAEFPSLS